MGKTIEFWFDVGSPAAYLAWTQLAKLKAATGGTIAMKPMLLGAVFQATGNRTPMVVPPKGAYLMVDFARYAKRYGVPLGLPKDFPINTMALMRGALVADDEGRLDAYLDAVYPAIFAKRLPMADMATVGQVLKDAGFDPARFAERIGEQGIKDRLKANTEEAVRRGIFGAPTFFVGDEMFFGQDRLDWVEAAAKA